MSNKIISVGILLDSDDLPNWLFESIRLISESNYASIDLLVDIIGESNLYNNSSARNKKPNFAYSLFEKLDKRLFQSRLKPDAFCKKNITTLLSDIQRLKLHAHIQNNSINVNDNECKKLNSFNLDILVNASSLILKGTILTSAKHGIWSHYHSDPQRFRGVPSGFWEVMEKEPATGAILEILSETPGAGKILCRSWSTTYEYSICVNRNYYYWSTTAFLSRMIQRLYTLGEKEFYFEINNHNINYCYSYREYLQPGTIDTFFLALKYIYKLIKKIFHEKLYWDQWYMLFNLNENTESNINEYIKIPLPDNEFWADPHIIKRDDIYYLFFEIYTTLMRKGHLAVMQIDNTGNLSQPKTILEKDYHLSYPHLVECNNSLYMIPETKGNNTIEIYQCKGFPDKWEFKMNLMEGVKAVDTTVLYHDEKWWLFTLMVDTHGARASENLYIFYSKDLLTQNWIPHTLNPVKSDTRSARPAGNFFKENGKIFRPAQDCSKCYGYGTIINEIITLSETQFEERQAWSIYPNWDKNVTGTHSYAKVDDLTVIDAIKGLKRF